MKRFAAFGCLTLLVLSIGSVCVAGIAGLYIARPDAVTVINDTEHEVFLGSCYRWRLFPTTTTVSPAAKITVNPIGDNCSVYSLDSESFATRTWRLIGCIQVPDRAVSPEVRVSSATSAPVPCRAMSRAVTTRHNPSPLGLLSSLPGFVLIIIGASFAAGGVFALFLAIQFFYHFYVKGDPPTA